MSGACDARAGSHPSEKSGGLEVEWTVKQDSHPSQSGHEDGTWQANPEKGQSGGDVIQPRLNHNYIPTRP